MYAILLMNRNFQPAWFHNNIQIGLWHEIPIGYELIWNIDYEKQIGHIARMDNESKFIARKCCLGHEIINDRVF